MQLGIDVAGCGHKYVVIDVDGHQIRVLRFMVGKCKYCGVECGDIVGKLPPWLKKMRVAWGIAEWWKERGFVMGSDDLCLDCLAKGFIRKQRDEANIG